MKKITALILAVLCTLCFIPAYAASDNEKAVTDLLSSLNIMKGDPDGNMRLDDNVTRAEFAKIAVACSAYKDAVALSSKISPFKDVSASEWFSVYVQTAVSNGICKGYTDATFRPYNSVLYEEAITMLLNLLGYTDSDFGASWPYGQIGMATNLEMTKNVSKVAGQELNRRDVANLVYNALDTKKKGSETKLIGVFDCDVIENAVIIATASEDSSLGSNKVYTSSGTYEITDSFDHSYVGRRGDLVVKKNQYFVSFTPNDQIVNEYNVTSVIGSDVILGDTILNINDNLTTYYKSQTSTYTNVVSNAEVGDTFKTFSNSSGIVDYAMLIPTHANTTDININNLDKYVIYSKLDDAIIGYQNGTLKQVNINDSTTAYKDKVKTTYASVKSNLSMGDLLYVKKDSSGIIDYVSYEKGNIDGPYTVNSSSWMNYFGAGSDVSIMRNGTKTTADQIVNNDIVYYSKDLNMIMAYSSKVTGIYEKATPNKDEPTSVVVSDVTYSIESVTAFNKLSSKGSFSLGDTVTLLLGKSGQIADVLDATGGGSTVYGYMYNTGTKEFSNSDSTGTYVSNYIEVVLTDGNTYQYIADSDYSDFKNSVVKVTFSNGVAKAIKLSAQSSVSGTFDWSAKKLGTSKLASDINIIDVVKFDSTAKGEYCTIFPQRLDGVNLTSSKIFFIDKNSNGEINNLILSDATGDAYSYGIVLSASKTESKGTYKYDINGKASTFTSSSLFSVGGGQPVKFTFDSSGGIYTLTPLTEVTGTFESFTASKIETSAGSYDISSKVEVYSKDSSYNYTIVPINDILSNISNYTVKAYYDTKPENGGRIRVIVASEKAK